MGSKFGSWGPNYGPNCLARMVGPSLGPNLVPCMHSEGVCSEGPVCSQRDPVCSQMDPVSSQREPVSSHRGPVISQRDPVKSQRDHISSQRWPGLVRAWGRYGARAQAQGLGPIIWPTRYNKARPTLRAYMIHLRTCRVHLRSYTAPRSLS